MPHSKDIGEGSDSNNRLRDDSDDDGENLFQKTSLKVYLTIKMLPIPMKFVFLAVYLKYLSNAGESPEEKEVRKSFVRYLKEDAGKHQVMILFNEEETKHTIKNNDFITKISRHVPTMLVSLQRLKKSHNDFIKHIGKNPRATTLFVSIVSNHRKVGIVHLTRHIQGITDLCNQYTRPKYLIVQLAKNLTWTYKGVLQDQWGHKFLDTTFLQVSENGTSTGKGLFEQNQRFLTRHQFNPYSSIISKEKDWLKSQWFPDKTKNLYKYPIILSEMICYPEDFMIYKVFAESINSTAKQLTTKDSRRFSVNFSCTFRIYFHTTHQRYWHICQFTNVEEMIVVVPRLGTYDKMDVVSWKLVLVILANVLLVIVLRLVLMLMKFDTDCWQMLDIFAVILGLYFLNLPKRVIERIVACCLLFGCIIYSGHLHTLLTEVELQTVPEQEVKTTEDLANLNLPLYTNTEFMHSGPQNDSLDKFYQALRDRTFWFSNSYRHQQCLSDLGKHKNVSCVFSLKFLFLFGRHGYGNLLIKNATIVEEPLVITYIAYIAQIGEVLMEGFNKYLLRMIERGLMSKWQRYPSVRLPPLSTEIENSDVNKSGVLHRRVMLYLAFGYGFALNVFFGELLFDMYQRKFLKQKILRGLRRIKRASCNMLKNCKRGCIWFFAKLRDGCRPSHLRRECKLIRSKLRHALLVVMHFWHRVERR